MANGINELNQTKFLDRLCCVVELAKQEGDITNCEAIGALEIIKLDLWAEQREVNEDDENVEEV